MTKVRKIIRNITPKTQMTEPLKEEIKQIIDEKGNSSFTVKTEDGNGKSVEYNNQPVTSHQATSQLNKKRISHLHFLNIKELLEDQEVKEAIKKQVSPYFITNKTLTFFILENMKLDELEKIIKCKSLIDEKVSCIKNVKVIKLANTMRTANENDKELNFVKGWLFNDKSTIIFCLLEFTQKLINILENEYDFLIDKKDYYISEMNHYIELEKEFQKEENEKLKRLHLNKEAEEQYKKEKEHSIKVIKESNGEKMAQNNDDYKSYEELYVCKIGTGSLNVNTDQEYTNIEIYKLSEKDKIFIPLKGVQIELEPYGSDDSDTSEEIASDCQYTWSSYNKYNLVPGIYRIKIKKDGYKTFTTHVTINESKCTNIDVALIKLSKSADYTCDNYKIMTYREPIPQQVKMYVWQRDGGRCAKCKGNKKLEYDHIIPLIKGGSNTERNIQLLCQDCNRSKGSEI